MLRLWEHLVAFGFRLLYNEMSWSYDAVSGLVSRGRWHQWQRTVLDHLPPCGRILEVGPGPGHTLVDLASRGYAVVGLDKSAAMLRQARRRVVRQGRAAPLLRAEANALPVAPDSFDAVVTVFPTAFVYDKAWVTELDRVLKAGGRLIVAELAYLSGKSPGDRVLESLYEITGQRGPTPGLVRLLTRAGLDAWRETASLEGSSVVLVIAEKPAAQASGHTSAESVLRS